LLLLLENALKINFEALQLHVNENVNPLQGSTHTQTPSSINTQIYLDSVFSKTGLGLVGFGGTLLGKATGTKSLLFGAIKSFDL